MGIIHLLLGGESDEDERGVEIEVEDRDRSDTQ